MLGLMVITITEALRRVNREGTPGAVLNKTPAGGMAACPGRVLSLRFVGRLRTIRRSRSHGYAAARLPRSRRGRLSGVERHGIATWFVA